MTGAVFLDLTAAYYTVCGSVHALLRYRSKTAKMQTFPIDSYSNENFISPFSVRQGPITPKRGENTSGTRERPHGNFGVNWSAGCWEIVDRTKKTYSKTNTSPFDLMIEWGGGKNCHFITICKAYIAKWHKAWVANVTRYKYSDVNADYILTMKQSVFIRTWSRRHLTPFNRGRLGGCRWLWGSWC